MSSSADADRAGDAGRKRRHLSPTLEERERLVLFLLLVPAILVTVALVAWPIAKLVQISLYELRLAELMRPITKEATLSNYQRALGHPDLPQVLWATAVFCICSTAVAFLVGLLSALALDRVRLMRNVLRVLVVSPWAIAPVVASLIWMFMLDERLGLANAALLGSGLATSPIPFITGLDYALGSVTLVVAWKEYPFFTVMLLAALQSIPGELYEAARIDGASRWRRFRTVTWPLLTPFVAVAVFLALLSAFRNVETILVMTGGGPARSTETLAVRVYTETFRFLSPGTGAALGVLTLAVGVAIAAAFWPLIWKRVR